MVILFFFAAAVALIAYFVSGSVMIYTGLQLLLAVILFFGIFISGSLILLHMEWKEWKKKGDA